MAAPTALESITSGDPGASGEKIANISSQEDATIEIVGGVAFSDRIASSLTADEEVTTTSIPTSSDVSDSTWLGTAGANLKAINNRGALVVWCRFEVTTDSATLRVVYYDAADAALFVGPSLNFVPTSYKDASLTPDMYLSEPQIVETYGASQYRIMVTAKGDSTNDLDVFAHPI